MDDNDKSRRPYKPLSPEQLDRLAGQLPDIQAAERATGYTEGPCLSGGPTNPKRGPGALEAELEAARLMGFDV